MHMHSISKRHSCLHLEISNYVRDGVIRLIHSLRCEVGHGNSFSIGSYLGKTKIGDIVSITVVHAEVCKTKHILEFFMCGLGRIF